MTIALDLRLGLFSGSLRLRLSFYLHTTQEMFTNNKTEITHFLQQLILLAAILIIPFLNV